MKENLTYAARSPDFSSCDFLVRRYVKGKVFTIRDHLNEEDNIAQMLSKIIDNMRPRLKDIRQKKMWYLVY